MNSRLIYLDLCRFLAICGVILVHVSLISESSIFISDSIAGLGRFGVQLFFAISGSTIYLSYNNLYTNHSHPLYAFYVRRLFRIIPLFVLMGLYYSTKSEYSFLNIISPTSGLDPRFINAISGGWSIWNEIYFYLLFPLYFTLRNSVKAVFIFALVCLILTNVIHFRLFDLGTSRQMADFDYLNIFNQIISFIIGVELMAKNTRNMAVFLITYFLFGIGIKVLYFQKFLFVSDFGSSFYLSFLSFIVILLIKLISYLSIKYSAFCSSLIISIFSKIGQITYTSYMIHFIIIDLVKDFNIFDYGTEINFLIISMTTFSLSYLLKPLTEEHFARLGYYLGEQKMLRRK